MSFWKKKPDSEPGETQEKRPETPLVLGRTGETKPSGEPTKTADSAQDRDKGSSIPPLSGAAQSVEDLLNERYGKTRSALSAGTVIQGKLSFDTPVRIDGKLSGEVYSSRALIIGPTGHVDAQIEVACLIVLGSLEGNAKATERVEIWAGGRFDGNVTTPTLVVQEGGAFSGDCKMVGSQKAQKETKPTEPSKSPNGDKEGTEKKPSYTPPTSPSAPAGMA